eukprot:6191618-Pleurochrysis_carterae.AAC.3
MATTEGVPPRRPRGTQSAACGPPSMARPNVQSLGVSGETRTGHIRPTATRPVRSTALAPNRAGAELGHTLSARASYSHHGLSAGSDSCHAVNGRKWNWYRLAVCTLKLFVQ